MSIKDLKDTFFRFPIWAMNTRPKDIGWNNIKSQESGLKPSPSSEEENKT